VGEGFDEETFTLTLRATNGGRISLEDRTYGSTQSDDFAYRDRVSISARPDWGYGFYGWSYTHGDTRDPLRESTTFEMPSRNVTVWAQFMHLSDPRWETRDWDGRWGEPFPEVPAALPDTPPLPALPPMPPGPVLPPGPIWPDAPPAQPVAAAEPTVSPLSVTINGSAVSFSGQPAAMVNGVPMVPIRGLFENLGYTVSWNDAARIAVLTRANIIIEIPEGGRSFTLNGMNRNLRAPIMIVNGSMMVPFVEIIEAVGGRTHLTENGVINIFITR
jgi:hypothetical protein